MEGFKYGDYDVFPAGQQLKNTDGSAGKWMALASLIRRQGSQVLALPVSWYPPEFDTEHAATEYAISAAKDMLDTGRCKI
jgi:hypothetical protein